MTFYVDRSIHPFRGTLYCHLMTDGTDAELIKFAEQIGMNRKWIQKAGTPHAHFDLAPSLRKRAVTAGAVEVRGRELLPLVITPKREGRFATP